MTVMNPLFQAGRQTFPEAETLSSEPQFPGGLRELYRFVRRNLKYPVEAREKGVEGKVIITFIVEKDGSISQVSVAGKLRYGSGLEEEALRVVNMLPRFHIPGMQNGMPVRVRYHIPIHYSLD